MTYLFKSRNVFFLLLLQFFVSKVYSQDVLWEKSYGGKQADYLMDVQPTADYGFILAGSSISKKSGNKTLDNNGDLDYWIWKMDEKGDLDWQKNLGGSGTDFLQSIYLTNDGGFILAGTSSSEIGFDKKEACKGKDDFWIIKLNAGGGEQWQKTIGGSGQEKLQNIIQTKDGGYLIAGSSSSDSSNLEMPSKESAGGKTEDSYGNLDYWVVKLDSEGNISWQKTIGGMYLDELRSIEQTIEGGYILGGYSNSPESGNKTENNIGNGDYWIVKLDDKGEIKWQKTIGGDKDDQLYVVHQTDDKGYIVGGNSNSGSNNSKSKGNQSGTDFWVLKLNEEGGVLWEETYNFGKVDVLTSLIENEDHTFLIGGYAQSELADHSQKVFGKKAEKEGVNDYIALKINEKGEELWSKTIGSAGKDLLRKVIETRDGGYLLAGTSTPEESKAVIPKGTPGLDNGKQNQQLSNATNNANQTITEVGKDLNDGIREQTAEVTDNINKAIGANGDSSVKYGLNAPTGSVGMPTLGQGEGAGTGALGDIANKKGTKGTRDKRINYGYADFWVVKLKDIDKPKVVKAGIEAFPNPTKEFTNVIVGYEFESGTATVVDLSGHVLQQFNITSRTVPINLSAYPLGIYIVNIKTNVQTDGVKVIKVTGN